MYHLIKSQLCFRFQIISIILFTLYVKANSEGISDGDFITNYDEVIKKVACEAMGQSDGSQMKVNLSRYSTHEELAKLAFWNYGNDFSTKRLKFAEDIQWKRTLVDNLFDIFQASCPPDAISPGYLNIFRELVMIYINSAQRRITQNTDAWKQLNDILSKCVNEIEEPYQLTVKGFDVIFITLPSAEALRAIELLPPQEKVDIFFSELDLVIDNFWWMFSHAVGRCYYAMQYPAISIPKLKSLFLKDILRPMLNRWADPGPLQDFGPIVGNFNIRTAQRNIRFCVRAAYVWNGITELQLVRPLKVGYKEEGINSIINKKTGATFG